MSDIPNFSAPAGTDASEKSTFDAYQAAPVDRIIKLVAFHAGLGAPSTSQMLCERLLSATRTELEARSKLSTTQILDLRPLAGDIALTGVGGPISTDLEAALATVKEADGLIAVSPVFQASYSGLFKGFIDIVPDGALAGAPLIMGATAGTARHSLITEFAMRPLFTYLKARIVTTAVFAASEDFGAAWADTPAEEERVRTEPLTQRVARAGGELADLIMAFPRVAPVDPFADFTPMGTLLGT